MATSSHITPQICLNDTAAARRAGVSTHNRFAGGLDHYDEQANGQAKEQEGKPDSGGYMTVAEVNAALAALRWSYPHIVTLIELPHSTWEDRRCFAVRLRAETGGSSRSARTGVLVTGGMLGCDWAGSDICVRFALRLVRAYCDGMGLTFGGRTFSAAQVRVVLERLDVFIFPQVNPDGKYRSQSAANEPDQLPRVWTRGNGNPVARRRTGGHGVEINRNFDFLWSAGEPTYGEQPFSEPETRNVRHLLAAYPGIGYYVNLVGGVIGGGNRILLPYTHASNRRHDPARGCCAGSGAGSQSSEPCNRMPPLDADTLAALADRMAAASQTAHGRNFRAGQFDDSLWATGSSTGSATDYAYSRHIANRCCGKVYALTVERGGEMIPPYGEMPRLVDEVGAALMELCWAANSAVYVRNNAADTGSSARSGPFWNSPDVWVRNNDDDDMPQQHVLRGRDHVVCVRVHNRGPADAQRVVVRVYATATSGAMYVYPQDWLPRPPSGGGAAGPRDGVYLVGDVEIPDLAAGESTVVSLLWRCEQIALVPGEALTLLVEVSPQRPTEWGAYVWQNPNLAQKNVKAIGERPPL